MLDRGLFLTPHRLDIIVLDPGRMATPELHASSLVPSPLFMLNMMFSTDIDIAVDRYMASVTSRCSCNRWANECSTTSRKNTAQIFLRSIGSGCLVCLGWWLERRLRCHWLRMGMGLGRICFRS